MPSPLREPKQARSRQARALILDSTLECLVDLGFGGTTTVAVCARAGVSRGALLHHFPTRAQLLCESVGHVFEEMRREFQSHFSGVLKLDMALPRLVDHVVDEIWRVYGDRRLGAVLELYVAARTDPDLRVALQPVSAAHRERSLSIARLIFQSHVAAGEDFEDRLCLALDGLQGLALRLSVNPDRPERTLRAAKGLLRGALLDSDGDNGAQT